jgi:Protein of unknown function (DUF2897)
MSTALIVALIVIAIIAGTVVTLRRTTQMGMPSKEVLERATRRSRELEAREKTERKGGPDT